jgi:hypothetical protein
MGVATFDKLIDCGVLHPRNPVIEVHFACNFVGQDQALEFSTITIFWWDCG